MNQVPNRKLSIREKAERDRQIKQREAERDEFKAQAALFEMDEDWKKEWDRMPEFQQKDLRPFQSLLVHFRSLEDRQQFSEVVEQTVTELTKSIWYPKATIGRRANKLWISSDVKPLRYPVYIPSKGRAESRLTMKALDEIGIPYIVVVEPQDYDAYASVINPDWILTLPWNDHPDRLMAVRNWIWDRAEQSGVKWFWILDDNIRGWYRLHNNLKVKVGDNTIFRIAEDFCDRYQNIGQAGFNYFMFAPRKEPGIKPFTLNTRIYSHTFIRTDTKFRWRHKFNDDTILSLDMLKAGWCTVLFNAFLAMKSVTMTLKGGNTDLYLANDGTKEGDGRWQMAQALKECHPDVTTVTRKWGRWQHHVDYSPFAKNKLIVNPDFVPPDDPEYGMYLRKTPPPRRNGNPF